MLENQTQYAITESSLWTRLKKFSSRCFQELAILDSGGTYLLTGSTTQTTIDVTLECRRVAREPAFTDSPHQVKPAARSVVFIAGDYVGRTSFETQAAVNAGEQLFFFSLESRSQGGLARCGLQNDFASRAIWRATRSLAVIVARPIKVGIKVIGAILSRVSDAMKDA